MLTLETDHSNFLILKRKIVDHFTHGHHWYRIHRLRISDIEPVLQRISTAKRKKLSLAFEDYVVITAILRKQTLTEEQLRTYEKTLRESLVILYRLLFK